MIASARLGSRGCASLFRRGEGPTGVRGRDSNSPPRPAPAETGPGRPEPVGPAAPARGPVPAPALAPPPAAAPAREPERGPAGPPRCARRGRRPGCAPGTGGAARAGGAPGRPTSSCSARTRSTRRGTGPSPPARSHSRAGAGGWGPLDGPPRAGAGISGCSGGGGRGCVGRAGCADALEALSGPETGSWAFVAGPGPRTPAPPEASDGLRARPRTRRPWSPVARPGRGRDGRPTSREGTRSPYRSARPTGK